MVASGPLGLIRWLQVSGDGFILKGAGLTRLVLGVGVRGSCYATPFGLFMSCSYF